jgi:hypothetical protein
MFIHKIFISSLKLHGSMEMQSEKCIMEIAKWKCIVETIEWKLQNGNVQSKCNN